MDTCSGGPGGWGAGSLGFACANTKFLCKAFSSWLGTGQRGPGGHAPTTHTKSKLQDIHPNRAKVLQCLALSITHCPSAQLQLLFLSHHWQWLLSQPVAHLGSELCSPGKEHTGTSLGPWCAGSGGTNPSSTAVSAWLGPSHPTTPWPLFRELISVPIIPTAARVWQHQELNG